ncbi:MAG: SDR family NAD(P)-dependent oxidoreductase [Planctomycetes bacterium]|nr:SDR family NAD(P)-dependent oxidoreductase [Planctomycetota bacterium]
MNVRDRCVLVTGAASGLGAACVRKLREAGARVVAFDRAEQGPIEGDGLIPIAGDVADESDARRAVDAAVRWGGLHGVVQCAGILRGGRLVSRRGPHPLDAFIETVRVNLIGTFNVARLACERIQANAPNEDGERGVLIHTSSIAAFEGQVGQAAYSASKGGVAAMTLPLARELGPLGIRVVAIAPGVFETPMMRATSDALRRSLAEQIPFPPRFGHPDEFAELVLHVFQNPMLNGTVLRLDGGLRMPGA